MKKTLFVFTVFLIALNYGFAQNLSEYLDSETEKKDSVIEVKSTFRTPRVVNLHSIEIPAPGELVFNVGHRFGEIRDGFYNLFGLDQSTIRLGFDYGLSENLGIGIGRSSFQKTYDIYGKLKILKQNNATMPLSMAVYLTSSYNSLRNVFPDEEDNFSGRLSYGGSLIMSRKFSEFFSLQIMPVWLKSNYLPEIGEEADDFSLGVGSRFKVSSMLHINAEYIARLNDNLPEKYDVISLGFDLETGGHVFQLFLSNTRGITEKPVLMNTQGTWDEGAIYFGFNITRTFYLN